MIYQFNHFTLDTESLELKDGGDLVEVEPQVFSLLACLIENSDRVVTKDEIIEQVWDGRIVSDGALNSRINSARRAVGDDGKTQAVIKTFPRRGFRFIANVDGDNKSVPESVTSTDKPSIAVLPFDNLSGDPEQEYFSDGITEDIITALSRLRWLSVIARNSTFSFKGQSSDIREISRVLDARYILEGSVRRAGDRLRISTQLIDGEIGNHLWAERYDRNLQDIFEVQDEVTANVAASVQSELALTEQRRARAIPPENLDAWEAYQRGAALQSEWTAKSLTASREYFERAMELDPNFVPAQAAYAEALAYRYLGSMDQALFEKAERIARKAVELDRNEPRAHAALGWVVMQKDDFSAAIAAFQTALELNPSDPHNHLHMGTTLFHTGRGEEAIPHFKLAIRLSPRDVEIGRFYARLSATQLGLEHYAAAVESWRKAVQYPNAPWAPTALAAALAQDGQQQEAERALAEALKRRPELTIQYVRDTGITPFPAYQALLIEGLRKARLPEN